MRGLLASLGLAVAWIALGSGCASSSLQSEQEPSSATLVLDEDAHTLTFSIEGQEACAYRFGPRWAIPHIWPLRSPSGRSLLVQRTEPYPHHRSLWVVDRVRRVGGRDTDFYHEWKNLRTEGRRADGHASFIQHIGFRELSAEGNRASAIAELAWIVDGEGPVLDQTLHIELEDLGNGEYSLDLRWSLEANYADVEFLSDWVHYGWPYLRMEPRFAGEAGGTITDDQGRRGQAATNGQYARWIDYSNTVEGITEGVAVLALGNEQPVKWLTREYGTFGPRRPDPFSGTNFVLPKGEALSGHARILVHTGDVVSGRVAERFALD